tara:strand:+ start:61 stop:645 length:585 start_codon:yes stop_codon:yes gene_type:complete
MHTPKPHNGALVKAPSVISLPLIVTPTRDCNFLNVDVSYNDAGATYPVTGELKLTDIYGAFVVPPSPITISTQYATASVVIPVSSLSITNGVINIEFCVGGIVIYSYPVLLHCDIDCCLAKLTNELIDCACDCPKCASSLAKAQKVFLLIKSAEYALSQAHVASLGNVSGYLLDAHNKYMKARQVCDNSCGCNC